jgi:hypothetical protein
MLITNDFNDEPSLMSYLTDVIESTAPATVRTKHPWRKATKTRHMQPVGLQEVLYELIADWRESGPNLNDFFKKHPGLKKRMSRGETILGVWPDGSGHITWTPITTLKQSEGEDPEYLYDADRALQLFMRYITSPLQEQIAGPCAHEECGRLFFKRSKHPRKYCSKRCAAAVAAVPAIMKKRKELRDQKTEVAQRSIEKWKQSKRRGDWKRWVERDTSRQRRRELRITTQWLTRAVGKGDIRDPEVIG